MGFIYTITNKANGKQYVGKTHLPNPQERWKEHLKDYKRERCEKRPLYSAMNKYGVENFVFEVIEECDNTEEREKFWIKELNTYGSTGYNATLGGDGRAYIRFSDDEIITYHCSDGNYIKQWTAKHFGIDPDTVEKILIRNNANWIKKPFIRQYMQLLNNLCVCQLDADTEQVIGIYKSVSEAAVALGRSPISKTISDVLNHRDNKDMAYGFKWKRLKDMPEDYKWDL